MLFFIYNNCKSFWQQGLQRYDLQHYRTCRSTAAFGSNWFTAAIVQSPCPRVPTGGHREALALKLPVTVPYVNHSPHWHHQNSHFLLNFEKLLHGANQNSFTSWYVQSIDMILAWIFLPILPSLSLFFTKYFVKWTFQKIWQVSAWKDFGPLDFS